MTTKIGNYMISTIDLETPATGNILTIKHIDMEKEFWYETMIFDENKGALPFQARYETRDEAVKGHNLTVKLLPKIIESPNKFPRTTFTQLYDFYSKNIE